jgi:catechol 2,3-dioxygenase-like lactoylglutathione lyase family enzyme
VIGHLGIAVRDLEATKAYLDVLMPLLDFEPFVGDETQAAWMPAGGKRGTFLFVYPKEVDGAFVHGTPGLQHLAFVVPTRSRVHEVHALVQSLGDEVVHAPREWPEYPPPYFATFWRTPDGFLFEAVCHHDRD